jgi:parallel beta-helix repeat protein
LKIYIIGFILLYSLLFYNQAYSSTEPKDENIQETTDANARILECGSIISDDVKLTSDLDCINSDGLVVGKSDITIDLNNHSISGTGIDDSKVGLVIMGGIGLVDSDTDSLENIRIVGPGKISDFQGGIMVTDSKNIEISNVLFQRSETGLYEKNSRDISVKESNFNKNDIGIGLDSSFDNEIINNKFNSNQLTGVSLVGSVENKVILNKIDGSINGIYLHANSENNNINGNTISSASIDINNGNGIPVSINNNTFVKNSCSTSKPEGLCLHHIS